MKRFFETKLSIRKKRLKKCSCGAPPSSLQKRRFLRNFLQWQKLFWDFETPENLFEIFFESIFDVINGCCGFW